MQVAAIAVLPLIGSVVLPPLLDEVASFAGRVPLHVDRFPRLRREYSQLLASYPELGPFAMPLAVIVAFGEIIPQVGPWIGRGPLLALARSRSRRRSVSLASLVLENLKP